jgi:hypothetical protein
MSDDSETQSADDWIAVFLRFIKHLRIDSKELQADDTKGSEFELWTSQKLFLKELAYGLSRGIRIFYVLKSRQLGISTISLAIDIFWLALHPGTIGCLVVDTESNRETFRAVIRRYIKSFPPNFFGKSFTIVKGGDNRNMMRFSNGSRLDFLVAGVRKNTTWAESKGYAFAHLCAAKGTPVIVEHGRIKAIEYVKIGEKLLTHTGSEATVVDVFGQPGKDKPMVEISPWLGSAIRYTIWHKIPTQRGLVQAGDLKKDDWLVMPVRKITSDVESFALPCLKKIGASYAVDKDGKFTNRESEGAVVREREAWSNITTKAQSRTIKLNEELGFAVGYYLAEGHMILNGHDESPCGIVFARHRTEIAYADRAINAIQDYTTGSRNTTDRKDSLTSYEHIYGTEFCRWLDEHFGHLDDKIIPDEVFTWGEDFCRGLLIGILAGDGSKTLSSPTRASSKDYKNTLGSQGNKLGAPRTGPTDPSKKYETNVVVFVSTRSGLAMQIRDIAASLGLGWAAVYHKEGGLVYGRNCKPCWRMHWNGEAAYKIRILMGLPPAPRKNYNFIQKYKIENGSVYIKIRKITECHEEEEVWDISVDHPDHTFRTPSMSTSNTEVSKYGDSRGLDSFKESMSTTNPNRLYIYESTANGFNHWRDMWVEAGRDKNFIHRMFSGWWSNDNNKIPKGDARFKEYGKDDPDGDEQDQIAWVKEHCGLRVSMEQLAWYRWRCSDTSVDLDSIHQLQPWNDVECFVKSGNSFFPMRVISDQIKYLTDNPPLFLGFAYELNNDFYQSRMVPITDQQFINEVDLKIWEKPIEGHYYAIGVDAALGRSDDSDSNVIEVFDCYADKMVQVAEWESNQEDTRQAAWVLAYIAGIYSNCRINVDVSGGYGVAIMNELDQLRQRMRSELYTKLTGGHEWDDFLSNASWYLYHRPDSMGAGYAKNWVWTMKTKFWACNSYRDSFNSGILDIKSVALLNQMGMVVRDGVDLGSPISARGRQKDDLVFAAILAEVAWKEWYRPVMINEGRTLESVQAIENGEAGQLGPKVVENIVKRFFAQAHEDSQSDKDDRPVWMINLGLA